MVTSSALRPQASLLTVLLGACLLLLPVTPARAAGVEPLPTREIARGIHVHQGSHHAWSAHDGEDVANIGFIVGARCVAVIDTGGSPAVGARLKAAIERVTTLPVCYVINTHMHPDHVLGNAALTTGDPGQAFIAHVRLGPSLSARAPYYLEAFHRDGGAALAPDAVVYPTQTVTERTFIDLGDRKLELRAWPTAHTDNDLTVFDQETGTLFTGDLLFMGHLPVIDGQLRGWLHVIGELKALDVKRAVPGHGTVTDNLRQAIVPEETYLSTVLREVRAAIKAGVPIARTLDQLSATGTAGWQLADEFHRRNLTAAYAELEWED